MAIPFLHACKGASKWLLRVMAPRQYSIDIYNTAVRLASHINNETASLKGQPELRMHPQLFPPAHVKPLHCDTASQT